MCKLQQGTCCYLSHTLGSYSAHHMCWTGISVRVRKKLMHVGLSFRSGEMQRHSYVRSYKTMKGRITGLLCIDVWVIMKTACGLVYLYSQNVSSFIPWDSTSGWRSSFSFTAQRKGHHLVYNEHLVYNLLVSWQVRVIATKQTQIPHCLGQFPTTTMFTCEVGLSLSLNWVIVCEK